MPIVVADTGVDLSGLLPHQRSRCRYHRWQFGGHGIFCCLVLVVLVVVVVVVLGGGGGGVLVVLVVLVIGHNKR